jgi:hypothetical protein
MPENIIITIIIIKLRRFLKNWGNIDDLCEVVVDVEKSEFMIKKIQSERLSL